LYVGSSKQTTAAGFDRSKLANLFSMLQSIISRIVYTPFECSSEDFNIFSTEMLRIITEFVASALLTSKVFS